MNGPLEKLQDFILQVLPASLLRYIGTYTDSLPIYLPTGIVGNQRGIQHSLKRLKVHNSIAEIPWRDLMNYLFTTIRNCFWILGRDFCEEEEEDKFTWKKERPQQETCRAISAIARTLTLTLCSIWTALHHSKITYATHYVKVKTADFKDIGHLPIAISIF